MLRYINAGLLIHCVKKKLWKRQGVRLGTQGKHKRLHTRFDCASPIIVWTEPQSHRRSQERPERH